MKSFVACALTLVILAASALLIEPHPAFACTQPPGGHPRYSVTQRTQSAQVVLEGRVTAVAGEWYDLRTATVEVYRYFKGAVAPVPGVVTIARFGPSGLCLTDVQVGDHFIVFATGDPQTGLTAHYMSAFDATAPVTPANVSEAVIAAGQPPLPIGAHYLLFYLPLLLK